MPEVFLAAAAAADFRRLPEKDRAAIRKLLHNLRIDPMSHDPIKVRSEILGTYLYLIRAQTLRLVFEINEGRVIVLTIRKSAGKARKSPPKRSKIRR